MRGGSHALAKLGPGWVGPCRISDRRMTALYSRAVSGTWKGWDGGADHKQARFRFSSNTTSLGPSQTFIQGYEVLGQRKYSNSFRESAGNFQHTAGLIIMSTSTRGRAGKYQKAKRGGMYSRSGTMNMADTISRWPSVQQEPSTFGCGWRRTQHVGGSCPRRFGRGVG